MFTREWKKGTWTLGPATTPISVKNISIVVAGPQVVTMTTRSRVSPVTDEYSLPLFSWHLDSLRCPRPISRMNSNRFPGKIGVAAFCSSVIKMWNLSLHDSAKDNCDQFLLVSQRPNVRHALSRKSCTLTFWITCICVLLVIGFAKILKWSLLAILIRWLKQLKNSRPIRKKPVQGSCLSRVKFYDLFKLRQVLKFEARRSRVKIPGNHHQCIRLFYK